MGRFWEGKFFPHARATQIEGVEVRQQLRKWFEQWGLPKAIRVDNGVPWATQSDIPSALALWLVGLGVKVLLNRPRVSTDNGIVERGHGVLAHWVEADKAPHRQGLQERLDWAIDMQRERYPACQGHSRRQAYPDLYRNPRLYADSQEDALWDIQRVYEVISQRIWKRRVDQVGRLSLFSTPYSVGKAYAGQDVTIHFDPLTQEWVMENEQGLILKRHLSQEITPERILNLNLAKRANFVSHTGG